MRYLKGHRISGLLPGPTKCESKNWFQSRQCNDEIFKVLLMRFFRRIHNETTTINEVLDLNRLAAVAKGGILATEPFNFNIRRGPP